MFLPMKIQPVTNTNPKISAEIDREMSGFVRYLGKYRNRMSEKQDILVNAIGTGLVAPIFIKFNPLSSADEKTKTYSAIRQTAMTAIGVTLQTLITLPLVNKFLDKQLDKGAFGDKFITDKEKLKAKGSKNIERLLADNKANRIGFKRIANLVAIFAVIPLTSRVLNITYPWFMEKFFPNTVNKKGQVKNA